MCKGQKVLSALTTELTNVQPHHVEIYYTKFNRYRSRNVRSRIQIHVRPHTSTVRLSPNSHLSDSFIKETPLPNFTKLLQLNHGQWLTDGQTDVCVSTSHKAIFLFHSVKKGSNPSVSLPCPFNSSIILLATAAAAHA
jgi:hypothetical protein